MNYSGDAAEQVVRMTLNGVEVAAKISGKAAERLAVLLYAVLKDQKKTRGKTRLTNMLKSGKELSVFAVKDSELQKFCEEAKKYGVLYAAVINKKQPDGLVDVVVNAADAAKVNRIAERFALSSVDVEKIREEIEMARKQRQSASQKERTDPTAEKESFTVDDKTLEEMMNEPTPQTITHKQPIDIEQPANPTKARTEKSNLSEPSFKMNDSTVEEKSEKPSVRKQIQEIKAHRADEVKKAPERSKDKEPQRHQNVKKKKSKGR